MKIIVLDGYALNPGDLSWIELESIGEVVVYDRTPKDKILERAEGAEIILTNKTIISKEIMESLPKLKYIGVLATGYNVVDIEAAKARGIVVTNVPAYSTDSVAQLVIAYILEFCNHVQEHTNSVKNGDWSRSKDFCYFNYPLIELSGKTLGIIGYGTIGKKVASIASAFGMKVLISSRTVYEVNLPNTKFVDRKEVFKESDFISIHCPLTEETKGMINKENISLMKKSAFLINTSRGPVIVDEDLKEALNNEIIAGAAVDVLTVEPPASGNPLLEAKNCFITPHIAWATKEARGRLMNIAVENVRGFAAGKVQNCVW